MAYVNERYHEEKLVVEGSVCSTRVAYNSFDHFINDGVSLESCDIIKVMSPVRDPMIKIYIKSNITTEVLCTSYL